MPHNFINLSLFFVTDVDVIEIKATKPGWSYVVVVYTDIWRVYVG